MATGRTNYSITFNVDEKVGTTFLAALFLFGICGTKTVKELFNLTHKMRMTLFFVKK